jgi:glycosyltransferase involved in cell wall biosynthesis
MSLIESLVHANELRANVRLHQLSPEDAVLQYGQYTTELFREAAQANAIPVVIPAQNEEGDIAATLKTIAEAGAQAIVVDNNSQDRTAYFARRMGATVLEQRDGRKMAATQRGLLHALGELGARHILFTDADTLVGSGWARAMDRELHAADQDTGAMVCGDSIAWESGSVAVDTLSMLARVPGLFRGMLRGSRLPIARGHNYGLSVSEGVRDALLKLDGNRFVGVGEEPDDVAIERTVREAGGNVMQAANIATWVVTRGDRITTLRQLWELHFLKHPYDEVVARSYAQQYVHPLSSR